MKSKTSYFNKTVFKKNFTHFWPIWLVILAWNLFILPFMIYNSSLSYRMMTNMTEKELARSRISDMYSLISVYTNPAMLFIFSVIAVMAVFSYLYTSRSANAMHAFPVSRKELFITNYISGLLFLIIPEAIGFLLGTLVGALCGYTSINVLLFGLGMACGISFVFYSMTVFIAMFAGQLFAVPVFAVILNFLYVGLKAMLSLLMSTISYGMPMSVSLGKLVFLSPLYYLSTRVHIVYNDVYDALGLSGGRSVAGYAIVSAAFVIAAYLIYRIRDMETAGSLISISWICPVFRWGAAFCGGALFGLLFSSLLEFRSASAIFLSVVVFALLFGVTFFFGAQMLLEKGFRVFCKKRMIECGVFLGIFVCLLACIECDLFGQEKKIPKLADIEEAYMSELSVISSAEEEEIVSRILDIHQQIIDSKREFESASSADEDLYYISVRYTLKNGTTLRRAYEIPYREETVHDDSSVIHKIAELAATPEVYAKQIFGFDYEDLIEKECNIDMYDADGEMTNHSFSEKEAELIYDAIYEDIMEGNFRDYVFARYSENENITSYENRINLEYTGKNGAVSSNAGYYGMEIDYASRTGYASVGFDQNCRHIIDALIETGVIQSEKDLTPMPMGDDMEYME